MNAQEQSFRAQLAALRAAKSWNGVLDLYVEGWAAGVCTWPMENEDFLNVFYSGECSVKAVEMKDRWPSRVTNLLRQSADSVDLASAMSDSDRRRVLEAYAPGRLPDAAVLAAIRGYAGERARDLSSRVLEYRMNREGREAARRLLLAMLSADTPEDGQYAAAQFGARYDLLMPQEMVLLSPRQRHHWMKASGSSIPPLTSSMAAETQLLGIPSEARARIASLLRPTTLGLRIQRRDFTGREIENLLLTNGWNPTIDWNRWLRFCEEKFGVPMREMLRTLPPPPMLPANAAGDGLPATFSVPILRLLHMKALLGTPALRPPSIVPESLLLVEIISHFVGNPSINYDGNLAFNGLADELRRDWRRKMAEPLGEAFAVLFLEDSVGLDLSSLSRIPETREGTPDFRAYGSDDRRIVIEAKGASSWGYFQDSIRKARQQLGKGLGSPSVTDRVFVCRTYIACQNSKRASQFAANDPPLDVDDYFGESEDYHALQHHFAGVAQFAGLMLTARGILEPRRDVSRHEEEARRLTIGDQMYLGTAQRIATLASSLGYALSEGFDRLSVFRGVEGGLHDSLRRRQWCRRGGRWPELREHGAETEADSRNVPRPPSGVGIVPDREGRANRGQGVYSLGTDGSVVAVVTDEVLG